MPTSVIGLFSDPYVRSFLEGLANWAGHATGLTVTGAFGMLWGRSHLRRLNAEDQRNRAERDLLKPRNSKEMLSAQVLLEFHTGLLTAFARHSLQSIKRNGVLRDFTLMAADLRASSSGDKPEVDDYLAAIVAFLAACWDHTNHCRAIDDLRDVAKARFPAALQALNRKITPQEQTELDKLGKRYLFAFLVSSWPSRPAAQG